MSSFAAIAFCLMLGAKAAAETPDRPNQAPDRPRDHAPPPSETADRMAKQQSDLLSLRASIGLGIGSPGVGGRLGVEGNYWLSDILGVGLEGGLSAQGFVFGASSSSGSIAPVVALRSVTRDGYAIFTAGAGYARVNHTDSSGLCLDLFGGGCPTPRTARYDGYVVDVALGWLTHPSNSPFEVGLGARIDVVADPRGAAPTDFIVTGNVAVGFGWLR